MRPKHPKFWPIPDAIASIKDISPIAKLFVGRILRYSTPYKSNNYRSWCWATDETLAREIGCQESDIPALMAELAPWQVHREYREEGFPGVPKVIKSAIFGEGLVKALYPSEEDTEEVQRGRQGEEGKERKEGEDVPFIEGVSVNKHTLRRHVKAKPSSKQTSSPYYSSPSVTSNGAGPELSGEQRYQINKMLTEKFGHYSECSAHEALVVKVLSFNQWTNLEPIRSELEELPPEASSEQITQTLVAMLDKGEG